MFTLAPSNRDQPDDVLLEDIRAVAGRLPGRKLTRDLYTEHGRFAPATIANRFGGWGRAVERAGLESARHDTVSKAEALQDLQRVAAKLDVTALSLTQYRAHGKYSERPYVRHFGSWVAALDAASLAPSEHFNPRSTDESLFENLENVWQSIGRQPTVNDMFAPLSAYSADTYKRRFGGWRKALEAFVEASASEGSVETFTTVSEAFQAAPAEVVGIPRTSGKARSVGWRLRYIVLCRDRFACRACGRSPATHPGLALQVDHVTPWSLGGETIEINLQTLCEQCNGGKGGAA
jgi:hypothetical protein